MQGLFRGVKIATGCPPVSHLFFADDSLIFFRVSLEESIRVKECLTAYERALGQIVNFEKSTLSFSQNTNPNLIEMVKVLFSILVVQRHNLYLGLPTISLKSKRAQFRYLVERVIRKIQGWENKSFSTGAREVMIKAVLQSIPTYAMQCFRIPSTVCEDIERECANFWWGMESGKRRMHWQTWDFLCKPKVRGGLGFRKLVEFNRALLAKQLWRIIQNPETLVSRILKGGYFKHVTVMKACLGSNPSYIWRSLLWSRQILEEGLIWRIGNGKSIDICSESPCSVLLQDNKEMVEDNRVFGLLKAVKNSNTLDVCLWMKNHLSKREFEEFAMQTWACWKEKQKYIHGDRTKYIIDNISWGHAMLQKFRGAKNMGKFNAIETRNKSEAVWIAPDFDKLKLNVDASVNKNLNKATVGGVLRDYQGRLLMAFCGGNRFRLGSASSYG
ncbi:uncharacterized protein [Henckelia pumila]|uniref:uncharacterized protein n=1 Tax=Henckelia pumila TaxID=405737 RepID=UPI003C6E1B4E